MGVGGHLIPTIRMGREVHALHYTIGEGNTRWVLELDKNSWTVVLIIHEEDISRAWRWHTLEEYLVVEK